MRFRVMMTIGGIEVDSSCVFIGTEKQAEASANRLNRKKDKHPSVRWVIQQIIN